MSFLKRHKWLTVAVVVLLPIMFFAGVIVIAGVQCCRDDGGEELVAADTHRSENEIAQASDPHLITIHSVALRCPLVRGLGCGSESKSILARLEMHPAVAGAWLNRSGTRLALLWKEAAEASRRSEIVASAFQQSAAPHTLEADERELVLRDFLSGTGWYRTSAVDELSTQEADIVARRWVGKITAVVPLPQKMRDSLHCALSERMRRRFVEN